MKFEILEGPADTATMVLNGKLDIAGAEVIGLPMSVLADNKKGLIVDLAALTFLASIGIRHLVSAAKALGRKGGRVVLLNPSSAITEVLETAGVAALMSIVYSESEARSAVGASA